MDRQRIIRHSTRLSQAHDKDPEDGITAEASEAHTADLDYPEFGTVLADRPDPGRQITVVGSRRTAAYPPLDDSWDDRDVAVPWHDSPADTPPGPEVHRGMSLILPPHVHAAVHDESRPPAERGLALARHLLTHPHPLPARGQGLGYSWTDDPETAKANAEYHDQHADWRAGTPVVLHARTPPRESWEDDPYALRERYRVKPDEFPRHPDYEHDPWSFPNAEDREVAMKAGSSVPLTGVSWARPGHWYTRDTSLGGHNDVRSDPSYHHLDFPEGLSAKASATYGRPDDARDDEYNGGEMSDTGMYWAEPGEQPWTEQHLGPQEAAPPPPWAMSPVMARLAQIEEACHFFGGTRHCATDINGTHIDNHGDAPGHGTVPRASDPDAYDERSTEGSGDPKWDDPADPKATREYNGSTVGMYPEGISAGGGPGMQIGAFTAAMAQEAGTLAARVPWTGHERATLHNWEDVPTGTEGDFVPSPMFTVPPAGGTPVPEEERMRAEGAWESPVGYEDSELPRQRDFDSADWTGAPSGRPEHPGEIRDTEPYDHREWTSEADPGEHRDGLRGRFDHTLSTRHEGASDSAWRMHFMLNHGLSDEQVSHAVAAGWSYPALNSHLNSLKREQEQRHQESLDNMFGGDLGERLKNAGPSRATFALPELGGHQSGSDPATAILSSEEGRPEYPDETAGRSHGAWLRLMNSRHEAAADPDEEARIAGHLRDRHGWNQGNIDRSSARGQRFSDMHDVLHQMGMADHVHQDPREAEREQSLSNMFGPDVRSRAKPPGWNLARPQNGGQSAPDPMMGLIRSRQVPPPLHPDVYEERDPARFRRMMSALDPPHPHDDDSSSLDAGPSEGDEGFPEAHDDLEDPDAPIPPQAWPLAGAGITEGGPAYTQGREDGHGGRAFPPPPPMPAPGTGDVPAPPGGEDGDQDGEDGKGKKIKLEISAHLDAFTAAADPRFRFEFCAAWSDVVAKAKRIRKEGHVRITHASAGMVIGEVRGDHDVYESGIQRPPGRPQAIRHWACGCPWASFHQDKALRTRYAGRPCSHVMALQFEAASLAMSGMEVREEGPAAWSPAEVTVKSWPPYEGDPHKGRWSERWLAPTGSLHPVPECYYEHDGPCRPVAHGHTAESLYHDRPADFYSEIEPNPEHSPHDARDPYESASHVLNGYLGPHLAGQVHFSRSDDGQAYEVHMMHTKEPAEGRGIASAMMDDLYGHVKEHGRWLDRGWRTEAGNYWWSGYAEPHPEVNTHHSHPDEGWKQYWSPHRVAANMAQNYANSRGEGAHTRLEWNYRHYPADDQDQMWAHARGLQPPEQRATAALLAAGEDPGEVDALRLLAGLSPSTRMIERHLETSHFGNHDKARDMGISMARYHDVLHEQQAAVKIPHSHDEPSAPAPGSWRPEAALRAQADQANAPWGSENVSHHPPVKPYGATEQPNKDQDPGSYGFLASPDPDNWGGIQDDSFTQSGITTAGSLPPHLAYPAPGPGAQEDQESFPYSDRVATAGPSASVSPGDPGGIRMEELLHDEPEPALPSTTGEDEPEHGTDNEGHRVELDPIDGWQHPDGSVSHDDGTTVTDHPVRTAAADGTIGGDSAGSGEDSQAPADVAALGEFGAVRNRPGSYESVRDRFRTFGGTEMGDLNRETSPQAQQPSIVTQEPGMGSMDEPLMPDDQSIQTIGTQQWSGGGADSDETAVPAGQPQGSVGDIVASFQRSAAASQYNGSSGGAGMSDGDIAAAARKFLQPQWGPAPQDHSLSKTADVLPDREAAELIAEGRGQRARNLGLLRLEGTHYEDEGEDLARRGVSLDDFDDDVITV